jgi:hypothetical protein
MAVMLTACDALWDKATDCIDNDRPKFNRSEFPVAVLNHEYSEDITASIENEPFDDWYAYHFEITGSLPKGLVDEKIDKRTLRIHGTPVETGSFPVSIEVTVLEPDSGSDVPHYEFSNDLDGRYDDGDDLCNNYRLQRYTFEVKEEETE